ncbi:hypothetical protein [Paenibacillus radicis (ex Gao et al. 2016)]|uniref:Uncharacterized protein n=1 Tax=Paenibacillus radicis (ex Gao et al. 2016) TaxID=1737354 RepID=A0A917GVH4_9BACL|nr:hypothetical protein [Paenibacillus radicis (ex Gao et al. 2016)]GGG58269.1 hypothetical protein GCM10010918_09160 [Paenibacillus radicis (ex Gao et al. 2016)]
MTWLAVQPYYKIQREISHAEQKTVMEERQMYLYKDRIETKYRMFQIEEIFDLSYKRIGGNQGFLYLHTQQGVFSYMVFENPQTFIGACKALILKK